MHGQNYYKSPAAEAKNTFSYTVMQVIWCLKFCNMTKSGGQSPRSKFWGGTCPPSPPRDLRPWVDHTALVVTKPVRADTGLIQSCGIDASEI